MKQCLEYCKWTSQNDFNADDDLVDNCDDIENMEFENWILRQMFDYNNYYHLRLLLLIFK